MTKRVWEQIVYDEVAGYWDDQKAIERLEQRIRENKEDMLAVKSARADATAVRGCGNSREDRLIGLLTENEIAQRQIETLAKRITRVRIGLAGLDDQDKDILLRMSQASYKDGTVEALCEKYHVEKSQLYRMRSGAAMRYKYAQWGRE